MRKRRLSAVPKLDVIDEDNTAETKSEKEKAPPAPSEDSTEEEEEEKPVEHSQILKKKNDEVSLVTPLRRSRRRLSSQSSDSEGEKSTSRKNTPITSSSKKRPNLKKVAMEPLIEDEGEAKEQSMTITIFFNQCSLCKIVLFVFRFYCVKTRPQETSLCSSAT